ncbi:MAG TPA: response regulator, partial [Anaerolineae bacterium]
MLPTTFSATILAIDDDPLVLDLLERMLIKQPYTVLRAEDADSAWQIIQTRNDLDLILLDVLMPGSLTGLDLCRKVRADQTRSYVPIILITALGQTEQMAQGLDAGADDYIAKPFRAREMLARVHAALRIRAVQRQLFEAENRYRVLVETSRDLIFALDANGWLSYVSPICETMTGYSAELLQAEYPPFARCLHPDDARRFTETLIARPTPPDGLDLEFRFVRSDKQVRWMALSWSPIRDRAQALIGLQGTLRDITHRREIEAATWQRSQELAALNLIATRVNQTLELDTTLNEALATLMEVIGIEFGTIHIVEEDQFVLHAVRGLSTEAARNWYRPFGGLDPAEWRTHAPIVARERSDQSLGEIGLEIKGLGVQAWMIVPLQGRY